MRTGSDKVTVLYRYILMDAFLEQDLNETYLNNLQNDFDSLRVAGLKAIFRFSYSNKVSVEPQQPNKEQMLNHLSQLSPLLKANQGVLFSVQAGFLGTWGEWY